MATFEQNPAVRTRPPADPRSAHERGTDLHISGEYEQALAVECENYERHRAIRGPDHPSTLNVANNRGNSHRVLGQYAEAEHWHRLVVDRRTEVLGPSHGRTYFARLNLAWDLLCLGRYQEAFTELDELRSLVEANLRPGHHLVLFIGRAYAIALRKIGRLRGGPAGHRGQLRAVQRVARRRQRDDARVGDHLRQLARRGGPGRPRPATWRPRPARACGKSFGGDNPITLATAVNLADHPPRAGPVARGGRHRPRLPGSGCPDGSVPEHPYAICAANGVATDLYLDGALHARAAHVGVDSSRTRPAPRGTPSGTPMGRSSRANAGLDLHRHRRRGARGGDAGGRASTNWPRSCRRNTRSSAGCSARERVDARLANRRPCRLHDQASLAGRRPEQIPDHGT